MQVNLSRHARQRLQQRGSRSREVAIVVAYADIDVPARDGCHFLRLSHKAARGILGLPEFRIQDIDRAKRLTVLVDRSDRVVTVIKSDPNRFLHGWRGAGRR